VRELPAINPNTGAPWRCITREQHVCAGPVIGAVGAVPCCANGVVVEATAVERERVRIAKWAEDNADLLRREAEAEQRFEGRYS
jgi:hypothetical protein